MPVLQLQKPPEPGHCEATVQAAPALLPPTHKVPDPQFAGVVQLLPVFVPLMQMPQVAFGEALGGLQTRP